MFFVAKSLNVVDACGPVRTPPLRDGHDGMILA
jgi:hypothetical protein